MYLSKIIQSLFVAVRSKITISSAHKSKNKYIIQALCSHIGLEIALKNIV